MKIVLEYLLVFAVVFIMQYIFVIRKNKKYNKDSVPIELLYLVRIYRIDVKKINYHKFLILYSLINSFIISTVYIIVSYLVKKIFIQLIVGAVLLILLIIICYGLLGRYYLKKEGKKYE